MGPTDAIAASQQRIRIVRLSEALRTLIYAMADKKTVDDEVTQAQVTCAAEVLQEFGCSPA
jgi:hypothetical protein